MPDRRVYLLATVLVFLALLIYLFFFNYGLVIQTEEVPETTAFVVNTSFHRIENIQISVNDKIVMNGFPLEPGQTRDIPLVVGKNIINAKAQNHLSTEETIFKQSKTSDISYVFETPAFAYRGINFQLTIQLCNKGENEKQIELEVLFDRSTIKNSFEKRIFLISENTCSEQTFDFIPIAQGQARIYFVLGLGNYTETIIKEIEVI